MADYVLWLFLAYFKKIVCSLTRKFSFKTITQSQFSFLSPAFQTRNVTLATLQALDQLQTAILQNKVPGEDHSVINTEAVSLVLQRQEKIKQRLCSVAFPCLF